MPFFDNAPRFFISPVFRDKDGWAWDWRHIGGDDAHRRYYEDRHAAWRDREATIAEFVGNNGPTLVVDVSPGMDCYTPTPLPCPTINTYYTAHEHRQRQDNLGQDSMGPDTMDPDTMDPDTMDRGTRNQEAPADGRHLRLVAS
jgi:hypothetical protein